MATRTLESRFERMSVNDENDPGDGTKYQKSKVCLQSPSELNDAHKDIDYIFDRFNLSIISEYWQGQSPQDCFTKSKHNKHNSHGAFPSRAMESFKHAKWVWITPKKRHFEFITRIR